MEKLALELPGFSAISSPVPSLKPEFVNLSSLLNPILNLAFYVAVFLAFYFLIWGAFQYMLAAGKKEDLAKARARIVWAIVGLVIVLGAYVVAKLGSEIFGPGIGGLPF